MNERPRLRKTLRLLVRPRLWPVRWRLAFASAGLTLFILVIFALVVGKLVSNRLTGDFHNDLRSTATELAVEARAVLATGEQPVPESQAISELKATMVSVPLVKDAAARVTTADGRVLDTPQQQLPATATLQTGIARVGEYDIATQAITTQAGSPPDFVQYGRTHAALDDTISRLWLFLAAGVLGGTLLATLAGLTVAARAMRPVSSLTAVAREIATTRDPSRRIPQPEADDEVTELAKTLDQMLRQLDAARSETQQMMQVQREFVADASHELRTPLTSILANLELLQHRLADASDGGEESEMVDSALSSSKRMRRLVSDLLLLARADAGRAGTRSSCDLAEIAEAALAEVRPVADGHRIELAAGDPVVVEADPYELHRMILNLLENGVRHTPAGTEIDMEVSRRNGHAVVEVRDDGPGIPAGMESQIFSRFVRGSGPADVSDNGGTGLGLAIVQAVASAHGGRVEAGSSPSGGARFTVELPLSRG
jgi:signal transduction histidine kinase